MSDYGAGQTKSLRRDTLSDLEFLSKKCAVDTDEEETPRTRPNSPSGGTVLLRQLDTRAITQEQLFSEVTCIYAGLVMVEKRCIEIDQQLSTMNELSTVQWQALIALHRTLIYEHHDFFLASQHPSASSELQKQAIQCEMPARMWRHGIHSFLEILRHRLPDSLDHMLAFVYFGYSIMGLLMESVPNFLGTWIECLGDLARYRMAIEEADLRDREIWSGVARMWYNKAADKSPGVGRIQHHLGVLVRPKVQQLHYYSKALVSMVPFYNARESLMLLFKPFLCDVEVHTEIEVNFVKANAIFFIKGSISEYVSLMEQVVASLDSHITSTSAKFRVQGPELVSSLIAAALGFGDAKTALLRYFHVHFFYVHYKTIKARREASTHPTDITVDRSELEKLGFGIGEITLLGFFHKYYELIRARMEASTRPTDTTMDGNKAQAELPRSGFGEAETALWRCFHEHYKLLEARKEAPITMDGSLDEADVWRSLNEHYEARMEAITHLTTMDGSKAQAELLILTYGGAPIALWHCFYEHYGFMKAREEASTHATKIMDGSNAKLNASWEIFNKMTRDQRAGNPLVPQFWTQYSSKKETTFTSSNDSAAFACQVLGKTTAVVSQLIGNKNILPYMHVYLGFLLSVAQVPNAFKYMEAYVPWEKLAVFLNTLGGSGVSYTDVEGPKFPQSLSGTGWQLPEDFIMRGLLWAQYYLPTDFFEGQVVDEEERTLELPSHAAPRTVRCLYIGVRLATCNRWLAYDFHTKVFAATKFAKDIEGDGDAYT